MLTALHALVYSDDPAATRRFFSEVLRRPFVSEGERGDPSDWLIFRTGPSELGVHPTQEGEWSAPRHHSLSLICDDLDATMAELAARGAGFTGVPRELGFGRGVLLQVPGADDLLLYQPAHATAHDLPAGHGAHEPTEATGTHRGTRMPVTEPEWEQHYAPEAIWSGNPNGALVAEVTDLGPGRVVDVGCGEGADAVWLAGRGWRVTAFDVADAALERGRAAAEAAGVAVDWVRAGLLSSELEAGSFDLVTACYPALQRTPERLAEQALLALAAPGGRVLMLAHADVDRATALEHGFDPDDYLDPDDLVAAASDGWTIERHERRPRSIEGGAGAGHHTDIVLVLRRTGADS
ncbi:MAG: methyltransferase domain-containing protein [Micropruina sp.]|nr:methyltransferase domain-containing protein [Micropruina sp.]